MNDNKDNQSNNITSQQNSNEKAKRTEKHIELDMTDEAMLENKNIRKNFSDNSGVN